MVGRKKPHPIEPTKIRQYFHPRKQLLVAMADHFNRFHVGDYVTVGREERVGKESLGVTAWVKHGHDDGKVDVEYVLERQTSLDVVLERVTQQKLDTIGRKRTSSTPTHLQVQQPSLLSPSYQASNNLLCHAIEQSTPVPVKKRKAGLKNMEELICLATQWKASSDTNTPNPAYEYLLKNQTKMAGWLRTVENGGESLPGQLSQEEKETCMALRRHIATELKCTIALAHAWGVSDKSIRNWNKKANQKRKVRSDKGTNILTSVTRQNRYFSPYEVFKKAYRREKNEGDVNKISDTELKTLWKCMATQQQRSYILLAQELKAQAPGVISNIQDLLHRSKGTLTWKQMEAALSSHGIPMVSHTRLRLILMGFPKSTYKSTKVYPALTNSHIIRRYDWTVGFWIFWESSKKLYKKVLVLLTQMDEKWFYDIVIRMFNKLIPFLGIEPEAHDVQHKSHIDKLMCLVSFAFLPAENNMEAGGRAFRVGLERAGKDVIAKNTTYKRHTDENGVVSYPKVPGNESRIAGRSYFEPREVTGSTDKVLVKKKKNGEEIYNHKYPLMSEWWPREIVRLEVLTRQLIREFGIDIIIRYQWDGAGPHTNKKLKEYIQNEFDERGWMFVQQPSQSPLTNKLDCCVFPALSKKVSEMQGVSNRSKVLDVDQIWEFVQKAYDEISLDTIGRAFAHHVQMVNAIHGDGGGDMYHKKGGLHCGVRKTFATMYNEDVDGKLCPSGVQMIEVGEDESEHQQLRYPKPDLNTIVDREDSSIVGVSGMWHKYLKEEEVDFFMKYLPEAEAAEDELAEASAAHAEYNVDNNRQ